MPEEVTIFVDESGDPNLNTDLSGTTDFYSIVGVIVKKSSVQEFEKRHKELFGVNECKSSAIQQKTRENRIRRLKELDFKYSALIVDKREIRKDTGLRIKKSFIKFLHRRLFDRLDRSYYGANVIADEHGYKQFMQECEKYYIEKHKPPMSLFVRLPIPERFHFQYGDSSLWRGIQVADLLAGTLRRFREGADVDNYLELISDKQLIIETWPRTVLQETSNEYSDDYDNLIQDVALKSVMKFLDANERSDDSEIQIQVETLGYLLDIYSHHPSKFVSTHDLINYLTGSQGFSDISEQGFRHIIGSMRSDGVAVVSGNKGYKIPNCRSDVESYISKVLSIVDPYISRLGKFRELLLESSSGDLDIFQEERMRSMKKYLDT